VLDYEGRIGEMRRSLAANVLYNEAKSEVITLLAQFLWVSFTYHPATLACDQRIRGSRLTTSYSFQKTRIIVRWIAKILLGSDSVWIELVPFSALRTENVARQSEVYQVFFIDPG
jgi:hypothetical protein